ncbi:amylo-alpha-1,6-glucosidase [Methanolobus sp. WCC4]|uniref:amylo-alpha-1,6-glucosidase n=1 Tax=Methanolobus sp. WCC4 TaxID=3125784 RepID=UPI0030F5264B
MSYTDHIPGTEKEWIISNGLGGYASSTTIGMNTRKYHGLLIASLNPPVERRLMLSSLDEELIIGVDIHKLAVHRYPDAIYPHGNEMLEKFTTHPFPTFEYIVNGITIIKQIMMIHGENTTIVRYDIINPSEKEAVLRILPLINNRSIHNLSSSNDLSITQEAMEKGTKLVSDGIPFVLAASVPYTEKEHWYYNFEYHVEMKRGYPYREDNFNPGYFELEIEGTDASCFVIASTEPDMEWNVQTVEELFRNERERQNSLVNKKTMDDTFLEKLMIAGDSFIVDRRSTDSKSVIAGYHWFGDWGRDTMISLPGLTLVTGRFDDARSVLSTFAANCKDGLIPNNFPENANESPIYNTVDASLWFIHAAGRYLDYTDDIEFVEKLWPSVRSIIDNYMEGTSFGIRMDDDGLIEHGGQLTWMDAKIGDWEITPRKGKACEINALWYNALIYATEIGERLELDVSNYIDIAEMTGNNFREKFWNEKKSCLYDLISGSKDDEWKDASVRPNQIFAVSLPHTMVTEKIARGIVDTVTEELLTPYGLRTLSPHDSKYIGHYGGNTEQRDTAYHNGTVWPWLLGPYITAYRKVNRDHQGIEKKLRTFLQGIEIHLDDAGIGTISEVFDGDSPHAPGGCISQAWSVAEVMRCYVEDVFPEDQ